MVTSTSAGTAAAMHWDASAAGEHFVLACFSSILSWPEVPQRWQCSRACEDEARRLAARLGSSDAALQRFAAAATAPAAADREARKGAKRQPRFAAGSPDNPIMLSQVKVTP